MGKFGPVVLASILNSLGVYIFTVNTQGDELLFSSFVFLLAVTLLLLELTLFPTCLRKLGHPYNIIVEFLTVAFLMENAMTKFWFPLEQSVTSLLPRIVEFESDLLKRAGYDCDGITVFLSWDASLVIATYVMSFFFLITILHVTRFVDLRLLSRGYGVFFKDNSSRLKKWKKRMLKKLRCNLAMWWKAKKGRRNDTDSRNEDTCRVLRPR